MRLEYVLGLRISFLHTIMSMRRVITLVGGIYFVLPVPAAAVASGCSSAVELEPSLFCPLGSSFSPSNSSTCSVSFVGNFNSSGTNSASVITAVLN
ncbi:hypothetical protein Lal_00007841 [Lupinus albus]|nr:hypothetical protein Lal_00007841 [Lupinus albus]